MMVGCMGAMVKVILCQEEKINGCVSLTTVQRESKPGDWDYRDVNDDHDDYHDDDCDDDHVYQLSARTERSRDGDCDDDVINKNCDPSLSIIMMMIDDDADDDRAESTGALIWMKS